MGKVAQGCLREVVVDAREETGFGDTKEETAGVQAGLVVDHTHEGHDGTPDEDDGGKEDTRRPALDGDVGEGLKSGVGDEEDGQCDIVVGATHVERLLHVGDTGIANVGAVEEGQEIEQRQPGNQPQVHFPDKGFVLCGVGSDGVDNSSR